MMKLFSWLLLFLGFLCWGNSFDISAQEIWEDMGPIPDVIDKSEVYPLRYGKKVKVCSDYIRKALWEARIRKKHPRIYLTPDTLPEIRKQVKNHPAYPHIQKQAEKGDRLANAFVFQLSGDKKFARVALAVFEDQNWLREKKKDIYQMALIFDWCYYAIEAKDMEDFTKKFASVALPDEKTDKGANPPRKFEGVPKGKCPLALTHSYFALAHHWPNAQIDGLNLWHPDEVGMGSFLGGEELFLEGSVKGGGHGQFYFNGNIHKQKFAYKSATGVDVLDEKNWGINTNNFFYWLIYNSDLEGGNYLPASYADKIPGYLRNNFRMGLHMLNKSVRNPHYQWFINQKIFSNGPLNAAIDSFKDQNNFSTLLIELALWWDPNLPQQPLENIPYARFLVPGAAQNATFRSSFKGKGDTVVKFTFSDSNDGDMGSGKFFGSFVIFKDEFLTADTHLGPFWKKTFGHNGLGFADTSSRAKTGFDRAFEPSYYEWAMHYDFIADFPNVICGTVTAFETQKEFDYVAFKNENTYYPENKIKEWSCQTVYLRPGILIRFDRSEVLDSNLRPRFMLYMQGKNPRVSGKIVKSIVNDYVEDFDGDELSFQGHLEKSKLHMKALLPREKNIRRAYGNLGNFSPRNLVKCTKRKF